MLDAATHWQRLTLEDPAKPAPANAARRIAHAMNLPDARALAAEWRHQRRTTRALLVALKKAVVR